MIHQNISLTHGSTESFGISNCWYCYIRSNHRIERLSKVSSIGSRDILRCFASSLTHSISYRTSALDSDSKLIYNWIRDSGSEGIWTKDLKKHTNLHINVVNRVLKALEHKQLVKSVKHVKVNYNSCYNAFKCSTI